MIVTKKSADKKLKVVPEMDVTRGLGFKFDLDDYRRMYQACVEAAKFMQNYGKGQPSYEIDLSHYENCNNP